MVTCFRVSVPGKITGVEVGTAWARRGTAGLCTGTARVMRTAASTTQAHPVRACRDPGGPPVAASRFDARVRPLRVLPPTFPAFPNTEPHAALTFTRI